MLHGSAVASENIAAGYSLEEAGLGTDAAGVFAPRPAALQGLFASMPAHSGGNPGPDLYEMADASAEAGSEGITKAQLGLTSTLWQVEKELSSLRAALVDVHPAMADAGSSGLVTAMGLHPHQASELLLGMCEACVTAAAVATTPGGAEAGATAQVPPGAVAALLRLQVAAGHGDRAETSLARAHEAGMLLQMRHYEPVLRLRATQRHLRESIALLRAMQERGVTANADVSDEAYALVMRCVTLSLEAGLAARSRQGAATPDTSGETQFSLQEAQESIAQSVDEAGAAVLTPADAERVATALLGDAQRELSHPGRVLLGEVERLFSLPAMRERGWQLARSEIGHDGRCAASGMTLERRQLRGQQLFDAASLIRQVIVEHEAAQETKLAGRIGKRAAQAAGGAAAGNGHHRRGASDQRAGKSVLASLDRHIANHGPFDLVIDGANLGLFRRSVPGGYLSYNQLDVIVQHCMAVGLKPLVVLHQRWMRPDDLVPDVGRSQDRDLAARGRAEGREEMTGVLGRWRRDCPHALFVVPRGNDDIYWMYAAMQSQRLKLRNAAAGDIVGEAPRQRFHRVSAMLREVGAEDPTGRAADAEAARAAAEHDAAMAAAPTPELLESLALRSTVWLVTNDLMRDHKGELMGWHSFGAWRSGVVKAIMERSPRWYAAGARDFDHMLQEIQSDSTAEAASASSGSNGAAAEDGEAEEWGAYTTLSLQRAARAFMRRRIAEPAQDTPPAGASISHDVRVVVPKATSVFDAPSGRSKTRDDKERDPVPSRPVTHARQVTPAHGSLALDQLRRRLWFVLPHAFQLRFHRPPGPIPAFFFPGFDKAVDDAGGVPDVPDAAARARRTGSDKEVSMDAAFESVVRESTALPLWEAVKPAEDSDSATTSEWRQQSGSAVLPGPVRWSEDRPEHPEAKLVMPPLRQWYVLFKQDQSEDRV